MPPEAYLTLLHAVEELRQNILDVRPNANVAGLNADIQELYDTVNSYQG